MSLFFIGGINGVGKTSITNFLAEESSEIKVLSGTEELMKRLGIKVGDYEKLRMVTEKEKDEAFADFFFDLKKSYQENDVVLVTGHYVKTLNGRITPSFGPWYGLCDAAILVVSEPKVILERILRDESEGSRVNRNLFGIDFSTEEKAQCLNAAQVLSSEVLARAEREYGIPVFRIENPEGRLHCAAKNLSTSLKGVLFH